MPLTAPYLNVVSPSDMVYGLGDDVTAFASAHNLKRFNKAANFVRTSTKLNQIKNVPAVQQDPTGQQRNLAAINYISQHAKYNTCLNQPESQGTRRKCKGILEYQLLGAQMPVHFVLGDGTGMKTELAARKLNFHTGNAEANKEEDVTHAELRWVFRNRHDARVARGVQFWRNGVAVGPPWSAGSTVEITAWSEYGNYLDMKRSGLIDIDPKVY